MKILHVCLCSQFNDELTYQENMLIKYHIAFGHDVSVLTSTRRLNAAGVELNVEEGESISKFGYKIIRLKAIFIQKLNLYRGLERTLSTIDPDFIFMHGTQTLSVIPIVNFCRSNSVKLVADNHADLGNSGQNWLSRIFLHKILWKFTTHYLVNFTKLIFGVSPIRCEFLHTMYKIEKKYVQLLPLGADDLEIDSIKNTLDVDFIKAKYNIGNEFVIVTGGKIDGKKNLISLLVVVQELKKYFSVKLIVFGVIYPDVLKEIQEKKLDGVFTFAGWLDPFGMYSLLLSSDLNTFIGGHSVLWEQAVACGKPTLFNKIRGMEHVNVCENSILLEDANNFEELYQIIMKLIVDREFYSNLELNSIEAAKSFSYSDIAKYAILQD